jgi:hypothetical protein
MWDESAGFPAIYVTWYTPDPRVIIGAVRVAEALEISSPSDAAIAWVFVQKFEDLVNRGPSDGNR